MIARPRNKYGAVRWAYNGTTYASKREANVAATLDLLVKAGKVKSWKGQVRIPLHAFGGKLVGHYVADFRLVMADDSIQWREAKGLPTPLYKWKKKHAEAQYNIKIVEV